MKLYIWEYLDEITTGFHEGGGLVIIARDNPQFVWDKYHEEGVRVPSLVTLPEADRSLYVSDTIEEVFVFPDQGCC